MRRSLSLLPLLILSAACDAAPVTGSEPAAPGVATGAAAPGAEVAPSPHPSLPERSVVKARGHCQSWLLGEPPRFVVCPKDLQDGEVLSYERDATCRRSGLQGREGPVACPPPSTLVVVPTPDLRGEDEKAAAPAR
jgi:hypothetical protein